MAQRRVVTDQARELARERACAYLAARQMTTGEVAELASYHARQARCPGFRPGAQNAALATSRMLNNLVASRTARAWYVAVSRAPRPARVRYRAGR